MALTHADKLLLTRIRDEQDFAQRTRLLQEYYNDTTRPKRTDWITMCVHINVLISMLNQLLHPSVKGRYEGTGAPISTPE